MNRIPQEQNIQLQLEHLAAQRQLYSDAKSIQNASMILSIPLVLIWSIFIALLPRFKVYSALWGIAVTFLDILILSRWQKSLQEKAAKIQQLFDCDILQLDWSKLNSGSRPEPEIIINTSAKYRQKYTNYSKLENWYPINVSQLPIYQARIICQRCNIWWDANLKRRYSNLVIVVLIAITIIVLLVGLIGGLTLEKFVLATLTPLIHTFVFGLRQYIDNNEAATRLDRLRQNSESIWQQVVNGRIAPQELEIESYSLQNQIYDNRRLSPLIFDWIYSRLQRKNEEEMNRGAEALIQDLRQSP